MVVASVVAIAAVAVGVSYWGGTREAPLSTLSRPLLLVRPVQAIGADPDQLAAGLWEELLVATSRIAPESLGVIARTTALKLQDEAIDGSASPFGIRFVTSSTRRSVATVTASG